MSVCLLYRGDVVPKDVNAAIASIKTRVARSGPEKAPFARYTRFLAGAAKIIALR